MPTSRREFLSFAALASSGSIQKRDLPAKAQTPNKWLPPESAPPKPPRPVTVAIIGAGARGNTYARYAESHPDEMKVVGVAEPLLDRREGFARRYGIDDARCYRGFAEALAAAKFADAVVIATPDNLHVEPTVRAVGAGYDVLLEKPIAPTWAECQKVYAAARRSKRLIAICHVLRYAPYFRAMKHVIDSGKLGEIVTLEHTEAIAWWHFAHSYVRGMWRSRKGSSPMVLAKSSHDMDIMRWFAGSSCKQVASFGSLTHFRIRSTNP